MDLKKIRDDKLLDDTKILVKKERECAFLIIKNLEEIFRRRLFSELGYSSLFTYATGHLGYSPSQAQRRINACRLIKVVPKAEEKLAKGTISLTSASDLFSHIQKENKFAKSDLSKEQTADLLKKIDGKSSRECERILAESSKLPADVKESKKPIKGKRVQIKFSLKESEYNELKDLMSELKVKSVEELFLKLKEVAKKKKIVKPRTVTKKVDEKKRYITQKVRREALAKSGGKCEVCGSNYKLEFEHRVPFAKGGNSGADNIMIKCKSCNLRAAIRSYGLAKMDRYINSKQISVNI